MTPYERTRNAILNFRRSQLRTIVHKSIDRLGTTDVELLRADTGIARPALLRALSELGYEIPLDTND